MKLNPNKCVFKVSSGKFLDFIVNQRGIETNPNKIKVVISMEAPCIVKDIQRLIGRIAALNQFISKVIDQCLPFFGIMC